MSGCEDVRLCGWSPMVGIWYLHIYPFAHLHIVTIYITCEVWGGGTLFVVVVAVVTEHAQYFFVAL